MHYGQTVCAIDRSLPVITKPDGSPITLNKTNTFSSLDIQQINKLYNCNVAELKPKSAYCIRIESNCVLNPENKSSIGLYHNNIRITTIPAGFTNFQHCLPLHWVDVVNDTFKLHIDDDKNVSLSILCSNL